MSIIWTKKNEKKSLWHTVHFGINRHGHNYLTISKRIHNIYPIKNFNIGYDVDENKFYIKSTFGGAYKVKGRQAGCGSFFLKVLAETGKDLRDLYGTYYATISNDMIVVDLSAPACDNEAMKAKLIERRKK